MAIDNSNVAGAQSCWQLVEEELVERLLGKRQQNAAGHDIDILASVVHQTADRINEA